VAVIVVVEVAAVAVAVVVVVIVAIVVEAAIVIIVAKKQKISREKRLGKKNPWGAYHQWMLVLQSLLRPFFAIAVEGVVVVVEVENLEIATTSEEEINQRSRDLLRAT
jgi:ABC-type Fe3+ transport system permease subunit